MNSILEALKKEQNRERACKDIKYHKSQREHFGVPVPLCQQIARDHARHLTPNEKIDLAVALWDSDLFDAMVVGAKILSSLKPSEDVWRRVVTFLQKVDGWALEDHLAVIAGKCIITFPHLLDEVETWTENSNMWIRRAALVYTLPLAKPHQNPERPLSWAALYAKDPLWFIQKAIGWWLRVLGAHNPRRVLQFLEAHGGDLKSVARKEATRKLLKI